MSFSYTLFLALMLIAPGLAVWAGLRLGEKDDLLSQAPEKPGSTFSLLVIVFGALVGHILMSGIFALQALWCSRIGFCVTTNFDPNVYRSILANGQGFPRPSDLAILAGFSSLLLPAVLTGLIAFWASHWTFVRKFREASAFGWLKPLVDEARPDNSFILAYVVTTMEHDGANVAYEGIVENLALDDNRSIAMLVLGRCDRFLVKINQKSVTRVDSKHTPIPRLQLDGKNFLNVALEVFVDEDALKTGQVE